MTREQSIFMVVLAAIMGAVLYASLTHVIELLPVLHLANRIDLVLFVVWLVLSALFVVLVGVWLDRVIRNLPVPSRLARSALIIGLPVFGVGDSSFSVVPYSLDVRFSGAGWMVGVNFVAAILMAVFFVRKFKQAVQMPPSREELTTLRE